MGSKTYQSIGKVLSGRENIILSRDKNFLVAGARVVHSVEEVLGLCTKEEELFIIGGVEIYTLFLPYVEKLYITEVDKVVEAITSFPNLPKWPEDPTGFKQIAVGSWQVDEGERFRFTRWSK